MARVLFSITDAQLLCLERLLTPAASAGKVDKRTVTGLRRRKMIEHGSDGRDALTPQGVAVLELCERLAIRRGRS